MADAEPMVEGDQPRPAPTPSLLSTLGDVPGPRCGHTLTALAPSGEPGTSGYVGPRLILFGGATALEGSGGAAGPGGSGGGAGIRKSPEMPSL